MDASDVIKMLKENGVVLRRANVYRILAKYNLYKENTDKNRPGLDSKKVKHYIKIRCSPLRLIAVARKYNVPYNKLNYIILKHNIPVVTYYGIKLFKTKRGLDSVKKYLPKI